MPLPALRRGLPMSSYPFVNTGNYMYHQIYTLIFHHFVHKRLVHGRGEAENIRGLNLAVVKHTTVQVSRQPL
jgi:hypothetical protein